MKIEKTELWRGKNYAFFCHKNCEAFPCHSGIDPERFNCLFCYCPLYALGEKCNGGFTYTEQGIKNCSNCNTPHDPENYGYVIERFDEIAELARRR